MARKPKTAFRAEFATSIEEELPTLGDVTPPTRRGRKPKLAVSAAEPLATMDSDDAAAGTTDQNGSSDDPVVMPVRQRPGPKPKQKPVSIAAAPLQKEAKTKPGRKAATSVAVPEAASAKDEVLETGLTGEHDESFVQKPASLEATIDMAGSEMASPLRNQDTAASAQPAAQWDRATDTVQFDWPEIERTAAQDGPNQVMAKLLVAARAEGANSRWPL